MKHRDRNGLFSPFRPISQRGSSPDGKRLVWSIVRRSTPQEEGGFKLYRRKLTGAKSRYLDKDFAVEVYNSPALKEDIFSMLEEDAYLYATCFEVGNQDPRSTGVVSGRKTDCSLIGKVDVREINF